MSIFFIGGASGTGKSHTSSTMAKELGIHLVSLDFLYNNLPKDLPSEIRVNIVQNLAFEMIRLFLINGITALIEGGWLQPESAINIKKDYPEEFFPVFCGYPNITAEDRLNDLRARDSCHYLTTSNDINGLIKQIKHSKSYQDRCEKYKLDFYDFSNIETGSAQLKSSIDSWHKNLKV